MYPTSLTQLARGNPFSAPLFSLQKVEEPQQKLHGQSPRRLAAAATADGNPQPGYTASSSRVSLAEQICPIVAIFSASFLIYQVIRFSRLCMRTVWYHSTFL